MVSPRTLLFGGMRAMMPLLLGVAPFGLIYGVLALRAGLPAAQAQAMSAIVFAGSAQFIAVQLLATGTPGLIVILTTLVVNLRHVLYSATLAPHLRPLRGPWKWVLSYLLVDELFALATARYRHTGDASTLATGTHWYMLGAGLTLWVTWQTSTAVGIYLGAQVPSPWALDFSLALTFIALVIPALTDRAGLGAAVVAGIVAVAAVGLPLKLGLVVASLAGVAAGLLLEARA
jgi:4-azaleucine resistance transporter AzlC